MAMLLGVSVKIVVGDEAGAPAGPLQSAGGSDRSASERSKNQDIS
jgi:hypothetical protein